MPNPPIPSPAVGPGDGLPILETYVWPNFGIPGSFAGENDYLESWLNARIAWMDAQFNP